MSLQTKQQNLPILLLELERAQVSREEIVRISSTGLCERWQSEWINEVNVFGKGKHLMLVLQLGLSMFS